MVQRFKALSPWPGIYLSSGLKLLELSLVEDESLNASYGIIDAIEKEGIMLTCKKGKVFLKMLQPASKNAMAAVDYIRGKRLGRGDTLV